MKLKSALEDLHETTIEALVGLLNKLEYFAHLRSKDKPKDYQHWGLARVYGELPATKALAQTHRALVSEMLSTPIRVLLEDVEKSSEVSGLEPAAYVETIQSLESNLLPPAPVTGSARHLSSVLQALSALLKSRTRNAIRRAS